MFLQTSKAQRTADKKYVDGGGSLLDLIFSAAGGLAKAAEKRFEAAGKPVVVVSGVGNNGNDGLACACILKSSGIPVTVIRIGDVKKHPANDTEQLLKKLEDIGVEISAANMEFIFSEKLRCLLAGSSCVLDCIFGTGFDPERGFSDEICGLISAINEHSLYTISADIPSGVSADSGTCSKPSVIANETVTFGAPKPGHFILPGKFHTGKLTVSPILITEGLTDDQAPEYFSKEDSKSVRELMPKRNPYGNKYTNGRVLVIAGSRRYAGAAVLAVSAALRSGAGLVTAAVPGGISSTVTAACPEAVRLPLGSNSYGSLSMKQLDMLLDASRISDSVVIGPGLGRLPGTVKTVVEFLKNTGCRKIIIDADALFAISVFRNLSEGSNPEFALKYENLFTKKELSGGVSRLFDGKEAVLTPHSGEAARLIGVLSEEIESKRLESGFKAARDFGCTVLLKGSGTVVCTPDGRFTVNGTGNSALSKGGSGDVLSGLIGGLMAQGLCAYDAARCGAFIHGLAAEKLSEKMSEFAVIPGDLGLAFSELMC